jgi:hypothetical protein
MNNQTGYEPDLEQEQSPTEAAFIDSENHEFDGIRLQPYSPMRLVAAQAMGLHHGRVDAAGMEQWSRVSVYPGAVRDVCIVLWLCSIKDEVQIDQAARAPIHAAMLAVKWGTDHGLLSVTSKKFESAYELFFKIMKEVRDSYGSPQKKIQEESETTG